MSLITITSGIGCGDAHVARRLSEIFQFEVYDDKRIQEEALALGISPEELDEFNKKAPGLLDRLLRLKPQTYLELMESVIYNISGKDDGVILGHGAAFLLRDFGCAFHVLIHSSISSRVDYLVAQHEMTADAARKLIEKTDDERRGFMRYAFRMDWDDPSLYDVVINRDKLGLEGAIQLITAGREVDAIQACSLASLESMERLSLAKRVEAAIIKNCLNPGNYHVFVPEEGIVYLTGIINPLESKDKLIDYVKAVPGVKEVSTDLQTERIHDI
ncbi:MAG: cytidylate kinase family protein [Deltaproteobacteria bacterium]|nr:cytidylate kinase family protein [Deltaproteobacteria bacterium]MBN2688641.1 cytidylate kinase family protein [Deltaproteobacteria bacterium]